ncbi:MAG: hypothetical protein LAO06_05550 [Acidobacteriia bacterium]|nr:hypothetical protein [Terriglobia bacterium]
MNDGENSNASPEARPNDPSPQSPVDNGTALGQKETGPSNNGETETERLLRGTRTIERLQFGANATLAVIGVIALCIYGGQLAVMRGQLAEMKKTTVIAQRPWLGIDGNATLEKPDHRWVAKFKIRNYGLSPGLHSVFAGETANHPLTADIAKLKIEEACSRGEALTGTELYPNNSQGHGYTIFPGAPSQTENITISAGPAPETAVALLGCMTYLDQFGTLHHTRFCQVVGPPSTQGTEFQPCFGGPNAD